MANQNQWRKDRRHGRDYHPDDRNRWEEAERRSEQQMWRERQGGDMGSRRDYRSYAERSPRRADSEEYRAAQSNERFARSESDRDEYFGRPDWPREPFYRGEQEYGRSGRDYGAEREPGYGFYDRDDFASRRSESGGRHQYEQRFDPPSYSRDRYERENRMNTGGGERGFIDKASDEVASWFGDTDAEHRRQMDQYRGVAPKGYTRSDDRIREDVSDRFTDDPYIDASDITITVANSEVTLSGNVNTRDQRRRAEDVAEYVSGVKHVQNNIRVRRNDVLQSSTDPTGNKEKEQVRQPNPNFSNFGALKP